MLFFAAFLFVMYFHAVLVFRSVMQRRLPNALPSFGLMGVGSLAFITGIGLDIDPSKGIAGNAVNWCVWLFLVLAIGTLAVTGFKLLALYRSSDRSPLNWKIGVTAWAVVAGAYMTFAVLDHLWFFYQDRENSGVANLDYIKAKDVSCKGLALVRTDENSIQYRCPETIVFGSILYSDPFVPWPAYTEGTSKDLKDALDALKAGADH